MFWRISLALYEATTNSFIRYTEPGKIKMYMACGLVVMTTRIRTMPWSAKKGALGS